MDRNDLIIHDDLMMPRIFPNRLYGARFRDMHIVETMYGMPVPVYFGDVYIKLVNRTIVMGQVIDATDIDYGVFAARVITPGNPDRMNDGTTITLQTRVRVLYADIAFMTWAHPDEVELFGFPPEDDDGQPPEEEAHEEGPQGDAPLVNGWPEDGPQGEAPLVNGRPEEEPLVDDWPEEGEEEY